MPGLIESAASILTASERRLEIAARNVANISTPGFKRQIAFSIVLGGGLSTSGPQQVTRDDFRQGALNRTSNPLDIAISGPGFFQLRAGDRLIYSRQGQFQRAADGTVVTPQGYALQQVDGGDLILSGAPDEILPDGSVIEKGLPIGRIAVLAPADTGALQPVGESTFAGPDTAMKPADGAIVRQGMLEASNVSLGDEMVSMMVTLRQSESGARLVQTYDDLLGRAITSFGQSTR